MLSRWVLPLLFVLLSGILAAGCAMLPGSGGPITQVTSSGVADAGNASGPGNVTVQETPVVPPGPPGHEPADAIGENEGALYYTASGNSVTGLRVDDPGAYHFSVVTWDQRSLAMFVTDWNSGKTIILYDSSKDLDNTSIPLDIHPGAAAGGTAGEATAMRVGTTFSGVTDTTVELVKGRYYIWAVSKGPYSFVVGYGVPGNSSVIMPTGLVPAGFT